MMPEREADLFGKLELLIALSRSIEGRLTAVESRLTAVETRLTAVEREVAEIKGRIADMPTARDFGRLEGRVAEMSQRLPTTIGYTPPKPAA